MQFSPVNTPGRVDSLWIEGPQPHEYFLHLFGKEHLDAFIAETNLLEGKILSKGHLGSCFCLEPISHEELLVFFG